MAKVNTLALLLLTTALFATAASGGALPAPEAIAAAEREVREEVRELLDPQNAAELATTVRLLHSIAETSASHAQKYAALSLAMQLQSRLGDLSGARATAVILAEKLLVDEADIRLTMVKQMEGHAMDTPTRRRFMLFLGEELNAAIQYDRYDAARDLSRMLTASAARLRDRELQAASIVVARRVEALAIQQAQLLPFAQRLERAPGDPAANTHFGRYRLMKGEFGLAMQYLSMGSDQVLKRLAEVDASAPSTSEDQFELAEQWWNASTRAPQALRPPMQLRASQWYAHALSELNAIQRVHAERRVLEARNSARTMGLDVAETIAWAMAARIRPRDELLAEARKQLDDEAFSIASGLYFGGFQGHADRAWTGAYIHLDVDNRSPLGTIEEKLTAEVRYLCIDGNQIPRVLRYRGQITLNRRGAQSTRVSGNPMTADLRQHNQGNWRPVDAYIIVAYEGVPIFEAIQREVVNQPWWADDYLIIWDNAARQ